MKDVLLLLYFVCLSSIVLGSSDNSYRDDDDIEALDGENEIDADTEDQDTNTDAKSDAGSDINVKLNLPLSTGCWMHLNAEKHFKILDEIDERYKGDRQEFQVALEKAEFDKAMIEGFIRERGAAIREVASHHHNMWMIPSGMNLGGYCMLRMPDSILFFHRMKLRNNTYFRVNYLHNDLNNLVMRIDLSLNDLHLKGIFERSLTDIDPSVLLYAPTLGEVEFLLKDVKYKIEGRYRFVDSRLRIELVTSEITTNNVLMTYVTKQVQSSPVKVKQENLGYFMSRLKIDLDKWIKDYFNDYLIHTDIHKMSHMKQVSNYEYEKGRALEAFTDFAIDAIAMRLRRMDAESIRIPSFTFKSIHGLEIKLHDGIINGLDTIFKRSIATETKMGQIRKIDCIVGFSSLKVTYKYQAMVPTGLPPLSGVLTLASDDLAAHLALTIVSDPETLDLDIEFLDQMKPEFLTVEGDANIMIANFKHLLEHQIIAIMSNALIHGVETLKSLPRCDPFVPGQLENEQPNVRLMDDSSSDRSSKEDILRGKASVGKAKPHRPKYSKSLKATTKINQNIDSKENRTILKKNKRKNRKINNKKQEIKKVSK